MRLPLPQVRRQVPERWRREWPLPAVERRLRRRARPRRADAPGRRHLLGRLRRRRLARRAGCRPPPRSRPSGPAAPLARRRCRAERVLAARPLLLRLNAVVLVLVRGARRRARPPTRARTCSTSARAARTTRRSPTACSPSRSAAPAAGVVVAPPNAPRFTVPGRRRRRARRGPAGVPRRGRHRGRRLAHGRAGGARGRARRRPARARLALARLPPAGGAGRAARSCCATSTTGAERVVAIVQARRRPLAPGPRRRPPGVGRRRPAAAAPCACWRCPGARPTCCAAAAASC